MVLSFANICGVEALAHDFPETEQRVKREQHIYQSLARFAVVAPDGGKAAGSCLLLCLRHALLLR
eukprot:3461960-Pleurochrysis_carterae.AAC.1